MYKETYKTNVSPDPGSVLTWSSSAELFSLNEHVKVSEKKRMSFRKEDETIMTPVKINAIKYTL